jgi:tellurium resistance protein TerD
MGVCLVKGQKVDLTKGNDGLKVLAVGLGWDVSSHGGDFDLDASAILVDADGKARSSKDLVYFGNKEHFEGAVKSSGDNLTGEGAGDDEVISVDLSKVADDVKRIVFVINIYDADNRNQNLGMVQNAFVRVVNSDNKEELVRYDLSEDFSIETGVSIGEVYRHNGEWKFAALGQGFERGLKEICEKYQV